MLCSDKDKSAADTIVAGQRAMFNLCGKTQLVDAVDLLDCTSSVVSNDSGLMHVAAAVGVKLNVIYGSSTLRYTPPLTAAENCNIYYLDIECCPCFKRERPLGHYDCLRKISVNDVFERINNNS